MTSEKLHDAISLLPSDLIAEADNVRSRKPRVILWKRYAAMAACFALVLCALWFSPAELIPTLARESSAEFAVEAAPAAAAPVEQAAPEEAAREESAAEHNRVTGSGAVADAAPKEPGAPVSHSVETPVKPSTACFSSTSVVTLVTSREELDAYLTGKDWIYDLAAMTEACAGYDALWFQDHDLLLLTAHAAPVDFSSTVTTIERTGGTDPKGWDWFIFYQTPGEDYPEGPTTCFHLLTELEKDLISPDDSLLPVADPVS